VISFLEGEVVHKGATNVVLGVGGIGYDVSVPTSVVSRLPGVGKTARIHTRMVVRDDSMTLYGFSSTDERELFDLLTGVTGVGPKVGLSFLSAMSADTLRRAVVGGDADALTVVPGVGKKVAQRVVVDLRDRLGGESELPSEGGPIVDVRDALVSLGLTPQEAAEATRDVEADGREVDDLLREALQKAGRLPWTTIA
jgi:Holliday junction DNA helicase RuvA